MTKQATWCWRLAVATGFLALAGARVAGFEAQSSAPDAQSFAPEDALESVTRRFAPRASILSPGESIEQAVRAAVLNHMEKAQCIETSRLSVCVAPGTPEERMRQILEELPIPNVQLAYNASNRWTYTATNGTVAKNTPFTLTYSFVPDGLYIPSGSGDPAGPSNLMAKLDAAFGSRSAWKAKFAQAFAEWASVYGIQYVEVADDGASFPSSSGSVGQRGDIRIGGHNLDGAYGVLAYCYYPNTGDMVLDTSESWANPSNDYRYLRNTVTHEHGHGIGLGHVYPTNGTKLMEPMLTMSFDGPQDDDIRGATSYYADPFEPNNSSSKATDLGQLSSSTLTTDPLATVNAADQDWFKFTVAPGSSLNVTVSPLGSVYQVGSSSGYTPTVNTRAISDLQIQVYNSNGSSLLVTQNSSGKGQDEVLSNYALPGAGGVFFVKVSDAPGSVDDAQRYTLSLSVSGPANTPPTISGVTLSPTVVAQGDTVHVTVLASDIEGLSAVTADGVSLVYNGVDWQGDISAGGGYTTHSVSVIATDTDGLTAVDNSATYDDVRIVGVNGLAFSEIPATASSRFLFRVWGLAISSDSSGFSLDAGSGRALRVAASGHGVQTGDFVIARGRLDTSVTPSVLRTVPAHITLVN